MLAVELLHHVRVAQRRDVAELAALGDVAQQPAHDLAGARLRQVVGPDDPLRPRELADPLRRRARGSRRRARRRPRGRPRSVTKAQIAWPVSSSVWPITAASATFGWETIADSISAVESRWPETLITSSIAADDPEVAVVVLAARRRRRGRSRRAEALPVGLDEAVVAPCRACAASPATGRRSTSRPWPSRSTSSPVVVDDRRASMPGQRRAGRAGLRRGERPAAA